MADTIHIMLFAYPRVRRAGVALTFSSNKVLALLCYMVMSPGPVSRDKLIGLLWSDTPEDKARSSLRSALYNIQQQAPGLLQTTRKALHIAEDAPLLVDVWDFMRDIRADSATTKARALDHYQGEFLAGFFIPNAPDFDHWLLIEQERLHRMAADYLEHAFGEGVAHDDLALRAARRLTTLEPWREDAYLYLMRHEARLRHYNAALKIFQQLRQYIWQELGVEPSAGALELAERIASLRDRSHHNLPHELPLFGRESELVELEALMRQARVLTLTGMGGVGKTHLALHLARSQLPRFLDGVWFVGMASSQRAADLPRSIARTLNIPLVTQQDAAGQLLDALQDYECLLLLDNLEQLLADASVLAFIDALSATCPAVRLLITSRERLRAQHEVTFALAGLATDAAERSDVRMFLSVAQRHHARFTPSEADLDAIKAFCTRVEGLPLAIEIAASTMHWQSIQALQHNFDQFVAHQSGKAMRHRSLNDVMDYSWSMLTGDEQALLMRFAVIHGRFSDEVLAAWVSVPPFSPAMLATLVEKSLLRHHAEGYSLHEVVRQYALRQLSPALEAISRNQHRDYFFDLLTSQVMALQTGSFLTAFELLTPHLDNLAAAWQWTIEQGQAAAFTPELFEALQHLLADRGYNKLFLSMAMQVADFFDEPPHKSDFERRVPAQLMYLYCLNWYTQDFEQFRLRAQALEQALRQMQAPVLLAQCIRLQAWHHQYHRDDSDTAEAGFREAYDLLREAGALHESVRVLNDLGLVVQQRQPAQSRAWWQQALEQTYRLNDPRLEAVLHCNMAEMDLEEGHHQAAEQHFSEALALQSQHYGVLLSAFTGLASIHLAAGATQQALEMAEEALSVARVHRQRGDLISAHLILAKVLRAMQRGKAAEQQVQYALRLAHQEDNAAAIEEIRRLRKEREL